MSMYTKKELADRGIYKPVFQVFDLWYREYSAGFLERWAMGSWDFYYDSGYIFLRHTIAIKTKRARILS